MRYSSIAAGCIVLFFCALFAGCTSPTQAEIKPVETILPTTTLPVTTATTTVVTTATYEPVVPLPDKVYVDLALTKDAPTGKIVLLLNGGRGMVVLQSVRMKVTRADGSVTDQLMNGGGQLASGSTLTIQGTLDGIDHCEVWVTSAGKTYKTMDKNVSTINPYS